METESDGSAHDIPMNWRLRDLLGNAARFSAEAESIGTNYAICDGSGAAAFNHLADRSIVTGPSWNSPAGFPKAAAMAEIPASDVSLCRIVSWVGTTAECQTELTGEFSGAPEMCRQGFDFLRLRAVSRRVRRRRLAR